MAALSSALLLLLVSALTIAAGQFSVTPPSSALIPLDFYQTVLFNTAVAPKFPVTVTVSFPATLKVVPAGATFKANQTSFQFFRIYGVSLTSAPVSVIFTAASNDSAYNTEVARYQLETITSCGVVNVDTCLNEGEWYYVAATLTKPDQGLNVQVSVSVQAAKGYDVFWNGDTNCPTESQFLIRYPPAANETVDTLTLSQNFTGTVGGSADMNIRVGIKRRANSTCSAFSVVAFDPNQDSVTKTKLTCTTPLAKFECSNTLLVWQIVLIVIGCVVGVVILGIAVFLVVRARK